MNALSPTDFMQMLFNVTDITSATMGRWDDFISDIYSVFTFTLNLHYRKENVPDCSLACG